MHTKYQIYDENNLNNNNVLQTLHLPVYACKSVTF